MRVREFASGLIKNDIKDSGMITKNMVTGCTLGQIIENTRATIEEIKNMDKGLTPGLMVVSMSGSGKTTKDTVVALIKSIVNSQSKVSGKRM